MLSPASSYTMPENLRKAALVFLVSTTLGTLYYIYLHYSETGGFPTTFSHARGIAVAALLGNLTGFAFYFFNHQLDRWISWKRWFIARFITGYAAATLLGVALVSAGVYAVATLAGPQVIWPGFSLHDQDVLLKLIILLLVTNFIYTLLYSLLFSYKQYAVTQIDSLQSERKQLELQFEALKSQLSPHYLFNSLNTISSLIYRDPESAEQFIRRLAQTYQYILSTQQRQYVSVKDELDFVQSYYYLLKIRFQQALTVEINVPKSVLNSQIPPLTLQILVENAVKHNTVSAEKPMFIYISALDNTHLRVTNTKNNLQDTATSFRIGLDNIRKRYQYFTDRRIEIKDTDKFMVSLPIIHPRTDLHKLSA